MPEDTSILLDTLDGFQFEHVVADILAKLGYGQVERVLTTQDQGRDILINSSKGLMVVECKHHPNGSIGRPIVQKLHSAVISSSAIRGILVTTGHFTQEAIEYARSLSSKGTTIEMVDRPILADMASRAGIRLVRQGENLSVWSYVLPAVADTQKAIENYIRSTTTTSPRDVQTIMGSSKRSVSALPLYVITYNVNAVFETNVGVIHRETASNSRLTLDGNTGRVYDDQLDHFFSSEKQTPLNTSFNDFFGDLPTFKIDSTSLQRKARTTITELHTRTVKYSGRNNRRYVKTCVPGEHQIQITDIRQVYLPLVRFDFGLIDAKYFVSGAHAPSGRFLSLADDVKQCRMCNSTIQHGAIICDTCGNITHSGGILLSRMHGFRCKRCSRTTCREHGHWRRRYLVWRETICPECVRSETRQDMFRPFSPIANL